MGALFNTEKIRQKDKNVGPLMGLRNDVTEASAISKPEKFSVEGVALSQGNIDQKMKDWTPFMDLLEKETDPNDPRRKQCDILKTSALRGLKQAVLSLSMGSGTESANSLLENAQENYNAAVVIRAGIIRDKLLQMNKGLVEELEAQMPLDADNNDPRVKTLQVLIAMARELTTTESNPFYEQTTSPSGKIGIAVLTGRINAHRDRIAEIKKTGTLVSPNIGSAIRRIESSLGFIENTDPIRHGYSTMNKTLSTMAGNFDTKPLRLLGVIGGGIFTLLGGGIMLKDGLMKGEWNAPTWPMYLWAGVAALCLKPSLVSSGATRGIASLQDLNAMGKQGLLSIGSFKGKEGAEAIEEIAEEQKNGSLKPILGQKSLNNAQIGEVAGAGSAVTRVLSRLSSDEERAKTLNEIAKQSSNGFGGVLAELVRTREKILFN